MNIVLKMGRVFYGLAITETGFQTIYYHDFPYWLLPPKHDWIPGLALLAYASGIMLAFAGACLVLEKGTRRVALLLGGTFLMIFCFYYIPYELMATPNVRTLVWHNAEKLLALCFGAFVIAGGYPGQDQNIFTRFLAMLIPLGTIFFSLAMISFGVLHLLRAKDVSTMVPSWIPNPIGWTYLAGVALMGSGVSIILKIKRSITAALLGSMILSWFVILHVPRVIASPAAFVGSEVTSAFLALAYSGIAFVIAGSSLKNAPWYIR